LVLRRGLSVAVDIGQHCTLVSTEYFWEENTAGGPAQ